MKFKIGFWNINGLGKEKYRDEDFVNIVNRYDILCLTETWREDGKNHPAPNGYKGKYHNRKHKNTKAKRNSGGILVLYKNELHEYIKVINNKDENILWLRIKKECTGLKSDLILGTVYMSPKDSNIHKRDSATETLDVLYEQMATFNENDPIILGGDFNARIGNFTGRVTEDLDVLGTWEGNHNDYDDGREKDINKRERVSEDKKLNAQGCEFLDFCTGTDLCILNGRTIGDLSGKFTYIGRNGCSVVDFALASKEIRSQKIITGFKVEDLNSLSDHRSLSISLTKNTTQQKQKELDVDKLEKRIQMPPFRDIYSKNLDSEEVGRLLESVSKNLEKNISVKSDIATDISQLEKIMSASMGGEVIKPKGKIKKACYK